MSAPATCPRCGRDLVAMEALAAQAVRVDVALRARRLALPDEVVRGIRDLASGLRCAAALCSPVAK